MDVPVEVETLVQAESPVERLMSATPFAVTEPFSWRELRASLRPAWMVSLPFSAENMPVERTVESEDRGYHHEGDEYDGCLQSGYAPLVPDQRANGSEMSHD